MEGESLIKTVVKAAFSGRFGPVEGRRNEHRLAEAVFVPYIWWMSPFVPPS
jgi:hypothetical protein